MMAGFEGLDEWVLGLILAVRLLAPGIAWSWLMMPIVSNEPIWRQRMELLAFSAGFGSIVSVLMTLFLGALDLYVPVWELVFLILFCLAGFATGRLKSPAHASSALRLNGIGLACMALLFATAIELDDRGTWVLGGWDPGVYVNQGIALAESGTFTPDDSLFHEVMVPHEQHLFTRNVSSRVERFPGVLVHDQDKSFAFEFFRATPAYFGLTMRWGGIEGIHRANLLLALLILPMFWSLAARLLSPIQASFGTLLLALQPIFIHHSHFPASEMLHLLCVTGLLYAFTLRTSGGLISRLHLLFLGCAMLNRFSFMPFAGLFIATAAWADLERTDRSRVFRERTAQISIVILAAMADLVLAPASIAGWDVLPLLILVTVVTTAAALILDATAGLGWVRRIRTTPLPVAVRCGTMALLTLALLASWWIGRQQVGGREIDNVYQLQAFTGWAPPLLALVGLALLWLGTTRVRAETVTAACWLGGITCLLLIDKNIVDWYPWATRRHLAYTLPVIALFAGVVPGRLWTLNRSAVTGRIAAVLLLLVVTASLGRQSLRAWSETDYHDVDQIVHKVADQLSPRDIVIADSPQWGTPLALWQNKSVLDGKRIWSKKENSNVMRKFQTLLQRWQRLGYRTLFLTTTSSGPSIYGLSAESFTPVWQHEPTRVELTEIIQHPKARVYQLKTFHTTPALYEWRPASLDFREE